MDIQQEINSNFNEVKSGNSTENESLSNFNSGTNVYKHFTRCIRSKIPIPQKPIPNDYKMDVTNPADKKTKGSVSLHFPGSLALTQSHSNTNDDENDGNSGNQRKVGGFNGHPMPKSLSCAANFPNTYVNVHTSKKCCNEDDADHLEKCPAETMKMPDTPFSASKNNVLPPLNHYEKLEDSCDNLETELDTIGANDEADAFVQTRSCNNGGNYIDLPDVIALPFCGMSDSIHSSAEPSHVPCFLKSAPFTNNQTNRRRSSPVHGTPTRSKIPRSSGPISMRSDRFNASSLQLQQAVLNGNNGCGNSQQQMCLRDSPSTNHDYERIPSCRYLQRPHSQSQRESSFYSSNHLSCQTGKSSPNPGNALQRRCKTSMIPKLFSSTYEGIFYKKKAFSERGFSSVHSQSGHHKEGYQFHAHAQQHAVLTKIITETNYEYEEEEEVVKIEKETPKSNAKETDVLPANDKKTILAFKRKSPRVTIVDKHTNCSSCPPKKTDDAEDRTAKGHAAQKDGKTGKFVHKESRIPRVILPGHRDPYLQLPEVRSDAGESQNFPGEEKYHINGANKGCGKCKVYKNLLTQSEATLRYLTQMLVFKDQELQRMEGGEDEKFSHVNKFNFNNTPTATPTLNPLVKEEDNSMTNKTFVSSESTYAPRTAAVLKFDLDEFIRKYFQNLLFTKDFQDSPFSPLQLFHVAISARDCMAHEIQQKLKHAETVLKQKYDILVSMKSSGSQSQPLDESLYFSVLDSYRRFLRYIYYYFKASLRQVEKFEQTYISQQHDAGTEETKKQMIYSYKDVVTINGNKYSAVIIPFQKIVSQDDSENCEICGKTKT